MDIGMLKNNTKYYDGFESDTEITLSIVENPEYNIHIYEGYFSDFFGSPEFNCKGWNGFTRDYNQMERTFGEDDYIISNVKEYLDDLLIYVDKKYEDEDTFQCYILLRKFLEYAINHNYHINVHVF
jgi:hypothetical protein